MKYNWPKISVITPSFNQGKYIAATIESVLSQSYPNVEYIIIDGGSMDKTVDVISEYQDKIDYFVSEIDNGQSHALNKGFAQATGDILCWLNSDDQFAPNALWSAAMAFKTSKADLIAGICEVYENDKLVHRHMSSCSNGVLPLTEILDLENGWNAGQFFYQPEVFFSRELWEKVGANVREDCYYSMDYELWCRFAFAKASIHIIGTPLVYFRTHAEQKTADPEKFKAELLKVRDQFCLDHNIVWQGSKRPVVNWANKLKIVLINDLGYQYGAGIAHMRIAGAFELAGHNVAVFDLLSEKAERNYSDLIIKVEAFSPHFIIFGNLHGVEKSNINVLHVLEEKFLCYWLTHDFWLLTGRCAYTGSCNKYLTGCDETCPTQHEYPLLKSELIKPTWDNKRKFLSNTSQFNFLANSKWAKKFVSETLKTINNKIGVHRISLGVPAEIFKPANKIVARAKLSITEEQFVIAFSVSSLSDKRKGGEFLVDALKQLSDKNITLILIGRLDQSLELPGIQLVKLGYVDNIKTLVLALNAADIYVGPSSEETFGQVFVEAAFCGTPSIGFDTTGVKDAIYEGITGLKVKELSATALKNTIMRLYDDRNLLALLSQIAPIYARNEFSLEASYGSFFRMLNDNGLIDKLELPHKISFSTKSEIITHSTKGWHDLSFYRKINSKAKASVNNLIGFLPNKLTAKVAVLLPNSIEKWLVKWLISRN